MALIARMRYNPVVWWRHDGNDTFGRPKYAAPVDLLCRWQDVAEEFLDADGRRQISRSKVFFMGATQNDTRQDIVDACRIMKPNDFLWRGVVADLPVGYGTPENINDTATHKRAWAIRAFGEMPYIRQNKILWTAMI